MYEDRKVRKYWKVKEIHELICRSSEEGLCILSNIPFEECDSWLNDSNAIYGSFLYNGKRVSVINIHLPWDSVVYLVRQFMRI